MVSEVAGVAAADAPPSPPPLGDGDADAGTDDDQDKDGDEGGTGGRFGGAPPSVLVVMGVAGTLVLRCRVAAAYERHWPGTRLAVTVGQA